MEPKWEDATCEHGGKWTVLVPKGPASKAALDAMWLNVLLACVGEQFTEGDEVCGVVVSVRAKQDKVALWTRTAANEAAQVREKRRDGDQVWWDRGFLLFFFDVFFHRSPFFSLPQVSIGKQLKEVLDLDSAARIGYVVHKDAMDGKAVDRYIV